MTSRVQVSNKGLTALQLKCDSTGLWCRCRWRASPADHDTCMRQQRTIDSPALNAGLSRSALSAGGDMTSCALNEPAGCSCSALLVLAASKNFKRQ